MLLDRRAIALPFLMILLGCTQPQTAQVPDTVAATQPHAPPPKPPPARPASTPAEQLNASKGPKTDKADNWDNALELHQGKTLFNRGCATCHGVDGTGNRMRAMYPRIGNLADPAVQKRLTDADFTSLIVNGRGKMPAFGTVLKPAQIRLIIGYARTLARQP